MIRAALDRGLHVFCEKPLTLSAATSAAIAEQASQRGLVAQTGYHNRFVGTFTEATESEKVQPAAPCVMAKLCPAMVSVETRCEAFGLA